MNHGFTIADTAQASPEQQQIYDRATKQFGFASNLIRTVSESPVLANAMLDLYARMGETAFEPVESHVVIQTINVQNRCTYCVPAQSASGRRKGIDTEIDNTLRQNASLDDPKLEALRVFTAQLVNERGHVSAEQVRAFFDAGYTKRHVLDIVFLNTVKTLTNYSNHIAGTDLDEVFKPLEWSPEEANIPVGV